MQVRLPPNRGTAPDTKEVQAPPPEDFEDAKGAHPPPGAYTGEMITFDMGSLALVHLALMNVPV